MTSYIHPVDIASTINYLELLNSRVRTLPQENFVMIKLKRFWGNQAILKWLYENTTGKLYFTWNKVGFENATEAIFFSLKFQ
jgi:hypothetical protein